MTPIGKHRITSLVPFTMEHANIKNDETFHIISFNIYIIIKKHRLTPKIDSTLFYLKYFYYLLNRIQGNYL